MENYQQRVVEEAKALSDKIKKLDGTMKRADNFMDGFSAADCKNRDLLVIQLFLMKKYHDILKERIAIFEESLRDGTGGGRLK